jgi:hypothetical protein
MWATMSVGCIRMIRMSFKSDLHAIGQFPDHFSSNRRRRTVGYLFTPSPQGKRIYTERGFIRHIGEGSCVSTLRESRSAPRKSRSAYAPPRESRSAPRKSRSAYAPPLADMYAPPLADMYAPPLADMYTPPLADICVNLCRAGYKFLKLPLMVMGGLGRTLLETQLLKRG